MTILNSIILGAVQGLTEFLPISSSGHLVIIQSLIPNFKQSGVMFDVTLHLASSFAVIFYFRQKLFHLSKNYILALIIATIPASIVGFLFQTFFEGLFNSTRLVGFALLLTASMNFYTDRASARREKVGLVDALFVGLAQAFAIVPGISRSGSTIFAGISLGVDREKVAEFSFILSLPAILGASFLEFFKYGVSNNFNLVVYSFGFVSAFASSLFAISLVFRVLVEKRFKFFALYCSVLGILAILL